ncbi:hypothetical protein AT15_09765 [Kosmotoga arenicorallina S304]|uniref:Uncharacterized protein n=1 Tax=Kosmotoga arenicorallina S304 TaxID=1453497 RepID=A0A176K109_9BACT|nr:ABC transporter permease subunit [Kosmotoga arenicorallina]OAA30705.1 hypothetical protein AT15_09765 [Kosmotoga arenicorallina S304]
MFYKEIRELKITLIIVSLLLLIALVATVAMKETAVEILRGMGTEDMPEFAKNLVANPDLLSNIGNNDFYLVSQWQGKNLGQFIPLIILIISIPIFAREIDKKTIYFLLSRLTRKRVFFMKYLTGLGVLSCLIVLFSLAGPIAMNLAGYETGFSLTFKILVHQLIGGAFFFSVFIFYSVLSNDQTKPLIIGIATIIGLPIIGIFKPFAFLNLYPYILGSNVFNEGIEITKSIVLIFITTAIMTIDYMAFQKREL